MLNSKKLVSQLFGNSLRSPAVGLAILAFSGAFGIYTLMASRNEASISQDAANESRQQLESDDASAEQLKDSLLAEDSGEEVKAGSTAGEAASKYSYIVKSGDTMSGIASQFNVSIESIAGSSGISVIDSLRVGQKLQIPSREGFFYSVNKGDRLAKILGEYQVSLHSFLQANSEVSPDLLESGDEIFLPGARPKNIVRSWLVPVASRIITSGYGWRSYPRRAFHKGLDLKASYQPVRAAKNGTVIFAGSLGGYGNTVVISHGGGYKSLYGHLSKIYVHVGSKVMQGGLIAQSGDTGYSFGAHLHFEVSYKGRNVNPLSVLTGLHFKNRGK